MFYTARYQALSICAYFLRLILHWHGEDFSLFPQLDLLISLKRRIVKMLV